MADDQKFCPQCKTGKPIAEFYKNKGRTDGLSGYCVPCQRASEGDRARRRRATTLAALGNCCVRCGFADARALQIDHVAGGGKHVDPFRATMAFYNKVLANSDKYQLLCANCNQIKKTEEGEHVGVRVYSRELPTERTQGVGRHNAEANARRAAGLKRWRDENPNAISAMARQTNADPAGRASRSEKQKAYWADADGEQQVAHRRKIAEAKARKKG